LYKFREDIKNKKKLELKNACYVDSVNKIKAVNKKTKEKEKKKEELLLAQKKAEEKEKKKEELLLAQKKTEEKEKKTKELKKINKKLSLLNYTELEKSQKIINYTKEFIKLYPDVFDIVAVAKKILSVKSISEGQINEENLKNLEELQKFTRKSDKFRAYEKKIIESENDQNIKIVDKEIENLSKKIKISKDYLAKNIDSFYSKELIELISKSEKTLSNLISLEQIQQDSKSLDILISKIDDLNQKIKIANDLNHLLKEKLKKSLSNDLAPLLIERIEKIEHVLNNIDIVSINTLIDETNKFVNKELTDNKNDISESTQTKNINNLKEKVNKSLEKSEDKVINDLNITNQNNSDSKKKTIKKKKSNQNKSDYLKLPNSKYLTVDAFKRIFDNKTLVIKYANKNDIMYGGELMFIANVDAFTKATIEEENGGVLTDIYYKDNENWLLKGQTTLHYADDITICDHTSRKICKKGAIVIGGNIFENLYAIIKSKGNYYFVVVHHNRDHTPGEFVVISPDRFHEIGFKVVELTDEDKISKQKTKDKAKQKKNEAAKSKQVGFKKKITLSCTYISSVGMLTENYQFEGHNVSWNGIPVELGVESNGLLVTRENTNIVKADLNGMVYTVNLKRETAMYEFIGQIITATCMKF